MTLMRLLSLGIVTALLHFFINTTTIQFTTPGIHSDSAWSPVSSSLSGGLSRNWSGYAATGDTFTSVSGTWIVPATGDNQSFGASATWVGIGGISSRDLIQAGTQTTVSRNGEIEYEAWYELLPNYPHTIPVSIKPGDVVGVTISQTSPDKWLISFSNSTTGKSYTLTREYDSSLSSAEWIVEAPMGERRILPLDDFEKVEFTSGSTVKNGETQTLVQARAKPITLYDSHRQTTVVASGLGSDGSSFSITKQDEKPEASVPETIKSIGSSDSDQATSAATEDIATLLQYLFSRLNSG